MLEEMLKMPIKFTTFVLVKVILGYIGLNDNNNNNK